MTNEERFYTSDGRRIRALPPPEPVYLLIPVEEWDRLAERLESCKVSLRLWSVAYSIMFGIAITAGLSIVPIAASDVSGWVLNVYIAVAAASLAAGIAMVIAEKLAAKYQAEQIDDLIADMARKRNSPMPLEN